MSAKMTTTTTATTTTTTPLRDLVAQRIEGRWPQFVQEHPNLAAAIDRVRLVDMTVERLRSDPQFMAAMRRANLDERTMLDAAALLQQIEKWIGRALRI